MAVTYTTRKGLTYYLHQGYTPTGQPRYVFTSSPEGILVDEIPQGYEIYESPNAIVYLRRIKPVLVSEAEVDAVTRGIEQYTQERYYKVIAKQKTITVHLRDQQFETLTRIAAKASEEERRDILETMGVFASYTAWLRFRLVDAEARRFVVERQYIVDERLKWLPISDESGLRQLVRKYIVLLGADNLFK